MAICLVAVKIVRERNHQPILRLNSKDLMPSEERDGVENEVDEVLYVQREIYILLLSGLFPALLWLCFHIFCPELLILDLSPKAKFPSESSSTSDLILIE